MLKKYCHKDASENSRSAKNRTECTGAKCKKYQLQQKQLKDTEKKRKIPCLGRAAEYLRL